MTTDIRTRARDAVRAEIADEVMAVFAERGYDAVTVEEASAAVGISRATFFRYFASKEEVVVAVVEAREPDYAGALERLPPGEHTGWQIVRAAFENIVVDVEAQSRRRRERLRIIGSQPALRARFVARRERLSLELADAIAGRIGDEREAMVIAMAALGALDVAWHEWAADDALGFREVIDAVFRRLEAGSAVFPG